MVLILSALAVIGGTLAFSASRTSIPADTAAARLHFILPWSIIPAVALAVGVMFVAACRYFQVDAIDGGTAPASRTTQIAMRYVTNTVEQSVLALIVWVNLAMLLPLESVWLPVLMAMLFGAGRALFWIAYAIAPWARAFGFALGFYPTLAGLIWLVAASINASTR